MMDLLLTMSPLTPAPADVDILQITEYSLRFIITMIPMTFLTKLTLQLLGFALPLLVLYLQINMKRKINISIKDSSEHGTFVLFDRLQGL